MEFLADGSVPQLAQELREDGATVADETAAEDDRAEAAVRSGGRAIRIREEVVKGASDVSKLAKAAEVAGDVWTKIATLFM